MVNKRINILFALLSLAASAFAAELSDVLLWSERPIAWSDFRGHTVINNGKSYIKTSLDFTSKPNTKSNGATSFNIGTEARLYRYDSYADSSIHSRQRLRYHQLQFDQLEMMRRRLQKELNSGLSGIDAESRLKYYRNLYEEQLRAIDDETLNGTDDHKLQEWEYFTRKNLEELGLPTVPTVEPSNFSYGLFLGVGGLFPTETIKDYFGSCFTFTAGLTGGYKRLKLKALIEYGQPEFKNANVFGKFTTIGDQRFYTQSSINSHASYIGVSTSLGFSIIDTRRFAITPHVGMYWSNYGWNVGNYEWMESEEKEGIYVPKMTNSEKKSLHNFNWMAGIDFDIKVHSYVSNLPFLFGKREQLTSMVRITPYLAHGVYSKSSPDLQGYQVGFTVSYVGIARALGMK